MGATDTGGVVDRPGSDVEATVDVIHRDGGEYEAGELRVDVIGAGERWVCSTYQPHPERYDRGGMVPETVARDAVPEWVTQALAKVGADQVVL